MKGLIVMTICVLCALIIFAVQNYGVIDVRFLTWSFTTSRAILIFLSLLIGIFIGYILALIKR